METHTKILNKMRPLSTDGAIFWPLSDTLSADAPKLIPATFSAEINYLKHIQVPPVPTYRVKMGCAFGYCFPRSTSTTFPLDRPFTGSDPGVLSFKTKLQIWQDPSEHRS